MLPLLAGVLALSLLLTLLSVPWMIRTARRFSFLDLPGPRKIHTSAVPYGGGIAVAVGVFVPILLATFAAFLHVRFGWFDLPEAARLHAPGIVSQIPRLTLLAIGSLLILLLGLVDDRHRLRPSYKLIVQTLIATGMSLGYERLSLFSEGSFGGDVLGTILTVLWIVGVTNAFNLLDHMDGLTTGVTLISCACFLGVAVLTGQWFMAGVLAAIVGGTAGFLPYNFPTARIFLGDAGSLFLGFLLATLTVSFTFYQEKYPLYSYAVPLVILAVPLFDTMRVVWIRLRQGRSPLEADTNHFAHRLTMLGWSRTAAVALIYALTLISGVSALFLYQVGERGAVIILAQVILLFLVITLLEGSGRRREGS